MRTLIKFCGLIRPEDVDCAVSLGVDAIGFVFFERSPRYLAPVDARALRLRLPSYVAAVGLFVDSPPAAVRAVSREVGLDVIQFHGDEAPEQCAAVAQPWWRAVRMRGPRDLLESSARFEGAECLLLDAYSEGYGGSGKSFDWRWIEAGSAHRVVLSGGLDAVTVGAAIATVGPIGVDVSSGIQGTTPRQKDRGRMEQFVAAVIRADALRLSQ